MFTLPQPAPSIRRPPPGSARRLLAKRAELRIEAERGGSTQRRRFATTVVESALDAIVVMDHEGWIVEFNPAAEEIFGYAREEALGLRVADLMLPEMAIAHFERLSQYLATGESNWLNVRREMTLRRADGTVFPGEVAVTTVPGRAPPLFVGFMRDLSDIKRTREALRDSELSLRESKYRLHEANAERLRLLRKLVAAHEDERRSIAASIHDDSIQAVSALAMRVSAMRRRVTDQTLRSSLNDIEASVSEAVSRLRRLMFDLHPTTLDRDGLAATVEAHLAQFVGEDSTTYGMDSTLVREPSQRVRLALFRIIQEAITNARKHARASNIMVIISEQHGRFEARVLDDGVGFPIDEIESPAGHLGLSTMRERAEASGGRISIKSTLGKGTIVEVDIPAVGADGRQDGADLPRRSRTKVTGSRRRRSVMM